MGDAPDATYQNARRIAEYIVRRPAQRKRSGCEGFFSTLR